MATFPLAKTYAIMEQTGGIKWTAKSTFFGGKTKT